MVYSARQPASGALATPSPPPRRYRLPKLAAWHAAALMRSLHSSSGWALYRQVSKEELQGMVEGLGVPIKDALIKRLAEIAIVNQLEFAAKLQQGWHKRT